MDDNLESIIEARITEVTREKDEKLEAARDFVNKALDLAQKISHARNESATVYGLADELEFDADIALSKLSEGK